MCGTHARRGDGVEGETVCRKAILIVKKQPSIAENELFPARRKNFVRVIAGKRTKCVVDNCIATLPLHGRGDDDFPFRLQAIQALDQDIDVLRQLRSRGLVSYRVTDRAASMYEVIHVREAQP